MPQVASRKAKVGSVVKGEFMSHQGYERKSLTVLVTSTMENGAVVQNDGDDTYSIVSAADVATLSADLGIVIDDTIYTSGVTGDQAIACLKGGPGASGGAIVVREALKFGDALSAGQVDTVVAAIEALGIFVGQQV